MPLALVSARRTDRQYNVDEREGLLYIRVNDTHPNFRVVAARLSTPQLREALAQAAAQATHAQWEFATQDERESRVALEAECVAIVDLDDTAKEAFRAAVRPLVERQYAELPPGIAALLR